MKLWFTPFCARSVDSPHEHKFLGCTHMSLQSAKTLTDLGSDVPITQVHTHMLKAEHFIKLG